MGTTTLMTFEQFADLEDEPGKSELLEGELIRMPPAKRYHAVIVRRLFLLLNAAVENLRRAQPAVRLGEVYSEAGYLLIDDPRSWLQPDVSINQPDQAGQDNFEGSPLFAFEVVSPEDRAGRLNRKVRQLLRHGAAEVWLIFPDERNAWVHDRNAQNPRIEDHAVRSPLLPGIEIPFAALFD